MRISKVFFASEVVNLSVPGKRQRVEAEKELIICEAELKQALSAAKARPVQPATQPPAR